MIFKLDGDKICCHRNDFTNLQECIAGFGDSEEEALQDFLEQGGEIQ